jgi:hypothetical protein
MTTYIVKKNNRRIPNKVFSTYEKARQWVRKKVRDIGPHWADDSATHHRTPALCYYGYSISKVEG